MRALVGLPMGGASVSSQRPRRGPTSQADTRAEAPPSVRTITQNNELVYVSSFKYQHNFCISLTDKMHSTTARDVHTAELVEEAPGRPEPARRDAVHDGVHQGEDAVRVEVKPLRDGPGYDGRGRGGEGHLEDEASEGGADPDALVIHEPVSEAHEPVCHAAFTIAHPIPKGPVGHAAQHHVYHVLHHDVHLVLERDAARLQHPEASLHIEDDTGASDHPQGVIVIPAFQLINLNRAGVIPELDNLELRITHGHTKSRSKGQPQVSF